MAGVAQRHRARRDAIVDDVGQLGVLSADCRGQLMCATLCSLGHPPTRSVLPSWSQGTEAASWAVSQRRLGCLAMPSYVARPHVLGDEFVPGCLGASFGLPPFVHGAPLASQFDSPPRAFEGTGGSLAG